MATTTGSAGWAQLRQQARTLEAQTETTLQTYAQFSTAANIPPKPTEEELACEAKLQDLLERREKVLTSLSTLLDSTPTTSATKQHNLTLLRTSLSSHRSDLARLRTSISTARDRANLLSTVRDDIESYRSANPEQAEAEYMLDERRRIDGTHNVADSVLSQAYATRDAFAAQRETLASVNRRIMLAASQVPGINGLIGRISAKKRRDGVIMGGFVAFCFLVFFFFM
ncbi:hypothetical protein DL546_005109 [Coniochaeta pulveracea]|uniref:Golgi SNAP receptor complex member 1 n=1 Tax=Coniochaeta pulveracea TaxID=177199 RepID=A0A420Y2N4_9PEZI|nr:hypothetical protein DL546_005109 [Coniochaeta pulveracea]